MTNEDQTIANKLPLEEKAQVYEVAEANPVERTQLNILPSGIVSFEDFDTMTEAKEQAAQVKNDASLFKAMVDNILELEPSEEFDKSQMIVDLAGEFSQRVENPTELKETSEMILEDDTKVTSEDFKGGCLHCGFGDDFVKSLDKCPYCHNET